MTPGWTAQVLDPPFLRRLDKLAMLRRRGNRESEGASAGRLPRASGLDWIDHRPYEPGDDLRYLDWPLYARLGRPYVRRFVNERSERVDLLVDRSGSMSVGRPPKADVASALGFAVGYVALSSGDRVGATLFAAGRTECLPAARGPAQAGRLLRRLQQGESGGRTSLAANLAAFAARAVEIGQVVVISDLLDEGAERGLTALRARGFEVAVVRLRADSDERPLVDAAGAELVDVETGERVPVGGTEPERTWYLEQRRIETERAQSFCDRSGIALASLGAWRPLPELVFGELTRAGIVS